MVPKTGAASPSEQVDGNAWKTVISGMLSLLDSISGFVSFRV